MDAAKKATAALSKALLACNEKLAAYSPKTNGKQLHGNVELFRLAISKKLSERQTNLNLEMQKMREDAALVV